ncbi:hypothetical protein FDP41_004364 [Naegleria fowleri]|uniref:Uncharacterized protein n=1 Tax=Naegleria fowleri TaxID=5763 RepID=A0A6A5BSU7_NAEFO|nr:uncharacterized protein FDP41_004364 [Naegleria fowleri]KAF0976465.1 hypothetical protein FDP41_004364 [Naegleria fowleri]
MKFSYVTFVPNKQQQQQKKGKRPKPLTMVSYFTDTERFSTSNPFNGSLDLSLHFNVETEIHSSRRHVPPPVQIVIPSPPQQQPPKPTFKPNSPIELTQPSPVDSPTLEKPLIQCRDLTSTTISYGSPHRKPRYAHPKDVCFRESMHRSPLPASMDKHLVSSKYTSTTITSTIPSPQKYDRARMIAPVSLKVNEMPNSIIGSRPLSLSGIHKPMVVPRKVRTSISLFELLNPEDDESM